MKQGCSNNGRQGRDGGEKGRGAASTNVRSPQLFSSCCAYGSL